jgi:hypothetical protein
MATVTVSEPEPVWYIADTTPDAVLQAALGSTNELVRQGAQAEIALRLTQGNNPPLWARE